jgi:hypothetical protein
MNFDYAVSEMKRMSDEKQKFKKLLVTKSMMEHMQENHKIYNETAIKGSIVDFSRAKLLYEPPEITKGMEKKFWWSIPEIGKRKEIE